MGSQIGISLDESSIWIEKRIIDYTCDDQYCCLIDHLIKQRLVVTTIEAFENLFKEMQRAWGLEPDASTYPIKV